MAETVSGVNQITFNIGNGKLGNAVKPALTTARAVQSLNKKNSLSALTRDLIMQYPLYIDNALDVDTQVIIAKGFEKELAALQLALWSADTAFGVDPTSTGGVRDFVKKYHSNSDTPDLISYTGNLVRNTSQFRNEMTPASASAPASEGVSADAEIEVLNMKPVPNYVTPGDIAEMWVTVEDRVTMESVNEFYLPMKPVTNKLTKIARALEAADDAVPADTSEGTPADGADAEPIETTAPARTPTSFTERYNAARTTGYKAETFQGKGDDDLKSARKSMATAKAVTSKELSSLEPTLIEVEFFVRDGTGSRVQKAIIGVKVMPRIISSAGMTTNIIAAMQGSHAAFQFVKWTRGEVKIVRDLIFGVSQIKKDAITKDKYGRYFGAMRKRRNNFRTFKFGDTTVNPFTIISISKQTADQIKMNSGYDLTDPNMAKRLINSLFLLGFQIVDTNTGIVNTILDEWGDFSDTTISAIKNSNSKESSFSDIKEAMRAMGRAY